jgi:hypothetical protein
MIRQDKGDPVISTADLDTPGRLMAAEIAEQPQVWRRLLDEGSPAIRAAAARIAERAPRFVLFVARAPVITPRCTRSTSSRSITRCRPGWFRRRR